MVVSLSMLFSGSSMLTAASTAGYGRHDRSASDRVNDVSRLVLLIRHA